MTYFLMMIKSLHMPIFQNSFFRKDHKDQKLKSEINRIDKEINQMVYGLTEEEIGIVEGE